MSQALDRIRRLETRTGLRVSRVIAPPHGVYSPTAARALARLGFGALCISNPYPWLPADAPRQPLAGWRPAEFVEGLPIIPRHHIAGDPEELVLRAFLRQPLVVYGHHTDAAHGLEVFSDAAHRIDSLGDVSWMDLDAIARTNAETFDVGDRTLVRLYSRDATIDLDRPATVVVEIDDVARSTWRSRREDGSTRGRARTRLSPPGRSTCRLDDATASIRGRSRLRVRPPWPLTRRVLTETRDRLAPLLRR